MRRGRQLPRCDRYNPTMHNGTLGPADGFDTDHHTAGSPQASDTITFSGETVTCEACHSMQLGAEHSRQSSSMSGPGAGACAQCHNDGTIVTGIVSADWSDKSTAGACAQCHASTDVEAAAAFHGDNIPSHSTETSVTGCSDQGIGCHGNWIAEEPDLVVIHRSGCTQARACHSPTAYNTGAKTCTNPSCHPAPSYDPITFTHRGTTNGEDTTHTVILSSMATTLTATADGTAYSRCNVCHSMSLKPAHNTAAGFATASLGWTNECMGCHNATSPVVVKDIALTASGQERACPTAATTPRSRTTFWAERAIFPMSRASKRSARAAVRRQARTATPTSTSTGCTGATAECAIRAATSLRATTRLARTPCPTEKTCGVGGACHPSRSTTCRKTTRSDHKTEQSGLCADATATQA